MMKKVTLLTLFLFSIITLNAQIKGYIIKDGAYIQGIISMGTEKSNMQQCFYQKAKISKIEKLTPDQIEEYGLLEGENIYVSHSITTNNQSKNVFIKQVKLLDINYYFYKDENTKLYFKKINDKITGINYEEFSEAQKKQREINRKNYVKSLNYSVLAGVRLGSLDKYNHLTLMENFKTLNYTSFDIGASMHMPTGNKFEIQTGLNFTTYNFKTHKIIFNSNAIDISSDFFMANIPFTINYNKRENNFSPLFKLGFIYSYKNFNKNNLIISNDVITQSLLRSNSLGVCYGAGIRYKRFIIMYQRNRHLEKKLRFAENNIHIAFLLKQNEK